MLNSNLDVALLRSQYQEDNRVRIDDFLKTDVAETIEQALKEQLKYDLIFFSQGKNHVMSSDQMNSLDTATQQDLQRELQQLAMNGNGFLYAGYRMEGEKKNNAPKILQELFEFMNGDAVRTLINDITGVDNIDNASGQYTRYTAGQYLTRHTDDIQAEGRLMAYILNFTKLWHPDWGGLLQFFEKSGVPRDAWEPRFNSVSLFDVQHIHSVTYVAPHAVDGRYALTGWFQRAPS